MRWMRSRVAWVAALVALFALLRALRRLVEADQRPVALVVAVVVVAASALLPSGFRAVQLTHEQSGRRKAVQFLAASAGTALAAFLGTPR